MKRNKILLMLFAVLLISGCDGCNAFDAYCHQNISETTKGEFLMWAWLYWLMFSK